MKEIKRFGVEMNFQREKSERRRRDLVSFERNFIKIGIYNSGLYSCDHTPS